LTLSLKSKTKRWAGKKDFTHTSWSRTGCSAGQGVAVESSHFNLPQQDHFLAGIDPKRFWGWVLFFKEKAIRRRKRGLLEAASCQSL
jgi:hypothetical protein